MATYVMTGIGIPYSEPITDAAYADEAAESKFDRSIRNAKIKIGAYIERRPEKRDKIVA